MHASQLLHESRRTSTRTRDFASSLARAGEMFEDVWCALIPINLMGKQRRAVIGSTVRKAFPAAGAGVRRGAGMFLNLRLACGEIRRNAAGTAARGGMPTDLCLVREYELARPTDNSYRLVGSGAHGAHGGQS